MLFRLLKMPEARGELPRLPYWFFYCGGVWTPWGWPAGSASETKRSRIERALSQRSEVCVPVG